VETLLPILIKEFEMKTREKIFSALFMTALAAGAYFFASYEPKGAQIISNLADANDITLTGNQGIYTASQVGTSLDPVVIDATAAIFQCVKIRGSFIIFRGGLVEGCVSHAVFVKGHDIVIEQMTVRHNVTENGINGVCGTIGTGGWGSGIKLEWQSYNVTVRDNTVYENCGEGIGATMTINALIENNIVRDNYSVNIYPDNSHEVVIRNNQVTCTGIYLRDGRRAQGIAIGEEYYNVSPYFWPNQLDNIEVRNNVVDGCHEGIRFGRVEAPGTAPVRNVTISGNSVLNGKWLSISVARTGDCSTLTIRDNIVYKLPIYIQCSGANLSNNTLPNTLTLTPIPPATTHTATIRPPTQTKTLIPTFTPTPVSTLQLWACTVAPGEFNCKIQP
jgi:hypothetical protein